jgi:ABC-2 type transport system permease protein
MAVLTRELRGSYAFFERNFNLVKRYWGWEIGFLVYAIAAAMSVTLIGRAENNERLIFSLMIGATFWNYLSVVFSFIAETITWERWEGTLEYTMMAPVRRITHLLGSTVFALVYGFIHTAVVLTVLILFFGLDLTNADFVTAGVFMLIGSLSIVGLGMMAAILPLLYVERGDQMTFVLNSLLLLFSGVYYSIEILPEWMQAVAAFVPGTYILEGIRQSLIDGVPLSSLLHNVWPLLVMAVVLIPAGAWAFSLAERYAKRTGKLKRVG